MLLGRIGRDQRWMKAWQWPGTDRHRLTDTINVHGRVPHAGRIRQPLLSRLHVLGMDRHPHPQRVTADEIDPGIYSRHFADVDRLAELGAGGPDQGDGTARPARRGDPAGLFAQPLDRPAAG